MIQLNDTRYPGQNVINLLLAVYIRQVPTFININLVLEEVATSHANVRILVMHIGNRTNYVLKQAIYRIAE